MTTQDPVGVALGGIVAGSTTGASIMTGGVFAVRLMQSSGNTSADVGGNVLSTTLFVGIVAAVLVGWLAAASISDGWRRAVVAATTVLGAALLAIGATVADQLTGTFGVGIYGIALAITAVFVYRAATVDGRT